MSARTKVHLLLGALACFNLAIREEGRVIAPWLLKEWLNG